MAVDKLVDSSKLNAALDYEASKIIAKGGGTAPLAFDFENEKGFGDYVDAIPSGDTLYYTEYGHPYVKNMEIPISNGGSLGSLFASATNMESVRIYSSSSYNDAAANVFAFCTNLKTANIEAIKKYGHYWFRNDQKLETVSLGKIGAGVSSLGVYAFMSCTQQGLTITVYVDDATTIPLANSPWGATNATIIYKSSTDGSVRTP